MKTQCTECQGTNGGHYKTCSRYGGYSAVEVEQCAARAATVGAGKYDTNKPGAPMPTMFVFTPAQLMGFARLSSGPNINRVECLVLIEYHKERALIEGNMMRVYRDSGNERDAVSQGRLAIYHAERHAFWTTCLPSAPAANIPS